MTRFSRVRDLTEHRFLIKDGETSTLLRVRDDEGNGREEES